MYSFSKCMTAPFNDSYMSWKKKIKHLIAALAQQGHNPMRHEMTKIMLPRKLKFPEKNIKMQLIYDKYLNVVMIFVLDLLQKAKKKHASLKAKTKRQIRDVKKKMSRFTLRQTNH